MNEERGQQVNPYAVPTAELGPERSRTVGPEAAFYAMSARKLAVMSVVTLGAYDLYFWWQQWRAQRQSGEDVSVFWRTTLSMFYAFQFRTRVQVALIEHRQPLGPALASAPLTYFVAQVLENVLLGRVNGASALLTAVLLSVARVHALFVMQESVNQLLAAQSYRGEVNRGISALTVLAVLAGVLLWLLMLTPDLSPP